MFKERAKKPAKPRQATQATSSKDMAFLGIEDKKIRIVSEIKLLSRDNVRHEIIRGVRKMPNFCIYCILITSIVIRCLE